VSGNLSKQNLAISAMVMWGGRGSRQVAPKMNIFQKQVDLAHVKFFSNLGSVTNFGGQIPNFKKS